jgi:hypothetical protein
LVRDLFREDVEAYYRDLLSYAEPELQTLENPLEWIDRLAVEAINSVERIDDLEPAVLAKAFKGALQNPNGEFAGVRTSGASAAPRSRAKRGSARSVKCRVK